MFPLSPRSRLRALTSSLLPLAAVTGAVVGLTVALFDEAVVGTAEFVLADRPLWAVAIAPGIGLALTAAALRWLAGGASSATSDEYVRAFHERKPDLPLRILPGRLVAGLTTIGFGGALGLEGPASYAGAAIGLEVQGRLPSFFRREDAKVLLTAGAAAGVSAVFKTPATGVVFALEAPYLDDIASRALVPSLVASATSYLTYVTLEGTDPVIPPFGAPPNLRPTELIGAVLVGLGAGLAGRAFAWAIHKAKDIGSGLPLAVRLGSGAAVLAGLALVAADLYDQPLTLGPGYETLTWLQDPTHALGMVAGLFLLRSVATITTAGAGGTGGLFIPLAVQGALAGRFVGGLLDQPGAGLYPTIGLAAFLGAGYRTPLSAVMFVAETSGDVAYVIPALIAAAVSQLVVGRWSVVKHQRTVRQGHLEGRLDLPIASALETDVLTVPPDATLEEYLTYHVLGRRTPSVPVVDAGRYVGMCLLDDLAAVPREEWASTPVSAVLRDDVPAPPATALLRDAVAALDESGLDVLPVVDDSGAFVGTVSWSALLELDQILDQTQGGAADRDESGEDPGGR